MYKLIIIILNFLRKLLILIPEMLIEIIRTLGHDWLPLSATIIIAVLLTVYMDATKLKNYFIKRTSVSIWGSVAFGALTPLCACGTSAVIIGMLTTTLPWGPIMAFLTSSPHMSPEGFVLLTGIIDLKFALAMTISSITIGIFSGYLTNIIDKKTNFLHNQIIFTQKKHLNHCNSAGNQEINTAGKHKHSPIVSKCCEYERSQYSIEKFQNVCCMNIVPNPDLQCCESGAAINLINNFNINLTTIKKIGKKIKAKKLWNTFISVGIKKILFYFTLFIAAGYLINQFLPAEFIMKLFNRKSPFSIILAAFVGFPIYISGESAIPLIRTLIKGGASEGAMLAFLITGQGTSAWVIAGLSTFLKKKVIGLYVLFLLIGGILLGYMFHWYLAL